MGIDKLVARHDKCLSCGEEYVEKQWDSSTITTELLLLELKVKNPKIYVFKFILWATLSVWRKEKEKLQNF